MTDEERLARRSGGAGYGSPPRPVRLVAAGLGSVGSKTVESIVRTSRAADAGFALEHVTLLDRDVLEDDNLVRHEALPGEVGLTKVDLMVRRLAGLAPDVEVEALEGSVFDADLAAPLDAAVARADVVVASFDNAPALFRLGELCARHGTPLLVAEVISGGIGLWLLAAGGGPDAPCLVCLARARHEEVQFEEPAAPGARVDYADPVAPVREARVPADDWTCGVAAALLAGQALDVLRAAARGQGRELPAGHPRLRLVALRRVEDLAPLFGSPLQTTVLDAPRQTGCAMCAGAPVDDATHARNLDFFGADEAGAAPEVA